MSLSSSTIGAEGALAGAAFALALALALDAGAALARVASAALALRAIRHEPPGDTSCVALIVTSFRAVPRLVVCEQEEGVVAAPVALSSERPHVPLHALLLEGVRRVGVVFGSLKSRSKCGGAWRQHALHLLAHSHGLRLVIPQGRSRPAVQLVPVVPVVGSSAPSSNCWDTGAEKAFNADIGQVRHVDVAGIYTRHADTKDPTAVAAGVPLGVLPAIPCATLHSLNSATAEGIHHCEQLHVEVAHQHLHVVMLDELGQIVPKGIDSCGAHAARRQVIVHVHRRHHMLTTHGAHRLVQCDASDHDATDRLGFGFVWSFILGPVTPLNSALPMEEFQVVPLVRAHADQQRSWLTPTQRHVLPRVTMPDGFRLVRSARYPLRRWRVEQLLYIRLRFRQSDH